jgi:hypothetical protein
MDNLPEFITQSIAKRSQLREVADTIALNQIALETFGSWLTEEGEEILHTPSELMAIAKSDLSTCPSYYEEF